jgi:hypothetical protein
MNHNKKPSRKKEAALLFFYGTCLILTSCRTTSDYSREALDQLHIQALKRAPEKSQRPPKVFYKKKKQPSPPIPIAMKKQVSVIITEEVPLRDAFVELARQAKVDLQLGCKITERVIFSANNRPFIEVVKDICDMACLRYKILGGSLRIEADTPYPVNYTLPFLNLSRTSENRIAIATDVFSNVKDNQPSTNNGSNSHIIGKGNNDFWTEVDNNLKIILTDRTSPLPTTSKEEEEKQKRPSNYSLHRQGGIITVYGTAGQHSLVMNYLESLREMASTQVLIEAKVIEVSLKDQYKSGINWQKVGGGDLFANIGLANLAQRGRFMDPTSTQTDMLSTGCFHKLPLKEPKINSFKINSATVLPFGAFDRTNTLLTEYKQIN